MSDVTLYCGLCGRGTSGELDDEDEVSGWLVCRRCAERVRTRATRGEDRRWAEGPGVGLPGG